MDSIFKMGRALHQQKSCAIFVAGLSVTCKGRSNSAFMNLRSYVGNIRGTAAYFWRQSRQLSFYTAGGKVDNVSSHDSMTHMLHQWHKLKLQFKYRQTCNSNIYQLLQISPSLFWKSFFSFVTLAGKEPHEKKVNVEGKSMNQKFTIIKTCKSWVHFEMCLFSSFCHE